MGCDIHPSMEAKIAGKWTFIGRLEAHRNYSWFGALSGVRNYDGEVAFFEICEPKSIEAPSPEIADVLFDVDLHSWTVIPSVEDLQEFVEAHPNFPSDEWLKLARALEDSGVVEEVRIVIAYDN